MKRTYTIAWNSYIEGAGYGRFQETVESRSEAINCIKAHLYYTWDKVDVTVRENGEVVQTLSYTGKQIGR
jgi:hypothetical protein